MEQKKKNLWLSLLAAVLLIAYILRIAYVNRDWEKTKIHYVSDSEVCHTDSFEITLGEERLYETAAYVKEFPAIRRYYEYEGSMYQAFDDEEGLRDIQYILYAEITVKNCTDRKQTVPYLDYEIYGGMSYSNGFDPFELEDLNEMGGAYLEPQESVTIKLPYALNKKSFSEQRYRMLADIPFSIRVSGYPYIQNIRLNRIKPVRADEEALAIYENLVSADKMGTGMEMNDTPEGTLLEKGEYYVEGGLNVGVSRFEMVDGIYDSELYHPEADETIGEADFTSSRRNVHVDEGGNVIDNDTGVMGLKYVFIALHVQNPTNEKRRMEISGAYLCNYTGKIYTDWSYLYFPDKSRYKRQMHAAYMSVEPGADGEVYLGYRITDNSSKEKRNWKLPDGKMYLGFFGMDPGKVDLTQGNPGEGKFLPCN